MIEFSFYKLGRIFKVENNYEWMISHTTPIATLELPDRIRIYFSTRSKPDLKGNYISNTSFIDVNRNNPLEIIDINKQPLLRLGDYGTFDEFGVMVTEVKKIENNVFMYYVGWQRLGGGTAAYQVLLGLAISKDMGKTFYKYSNGPILGIDTFDPISIGNVAVFVDDSIIRMYYTSLTKWLITGIKPTYEYVINYANSFDGIEWQKSRKTVIGMKDKFGVATPTVIKLNDIYHMWFGFRKGYENNNKIGSYVIGYATSKDGINWFRNDKAAGITLSKDGWDSGMICYPSILKVDENLFLFYCGNEFGKEGFGVAEFKLN